MAEEKISIPMSAHAIVSSVEGEWDTNDQRSMTVTSPGFPSAKTGYRYFLSKYNVPAAERKREVLGVTLACTVSTEIGTWCSVETDCVRQEFDTATATYRNLLYRKDMHWYTKTLYAAAGKLESELTYFDAMYALRFGLCIRPFEGVSATPAKNLEVVFGDVEKREIDFLHINSLTFNPTDNVSCSIDCTESNRIDISTKPTLSVDPPKLTTAKLRLRAKGAEEYTEVDLSYGINTAGDEVTAALEGNMVPAEAKQSGKMELQFVIEDNFGGSDSTPWINANVYHIVFAGVSPSKGAFVNRFKDATFYAAVYSGITLKKFRYRKKGEENYTETDAIIENKKYVMPANTINDGAEYEYQFTAVDKYNEPWNSSWKNFTTVDKISTASAVYPAGALIDADKANVFRWEHIISTGSTQTKAELQKSDDAETWEELGSVTGAETAFTVATDTFLSGVWYWRVRTYNADNAAGEWSAAAQFIAVATPATPIITIEDTSPKPAIRWETNEQQAYEISVDGTVKKYYGVDKTWKSETFMEDGQHTITVRIQNGYGRWSESATIVIEVTNAQGDKITLTANAGELWWNTEGNYGYYLVYRDLDLIGRTSVKNLTDPTANGNVRYQVRGCYNDSDNYGLSNSAEVTVERKYYEIYDMESGVTLTVRYCGLSDQQVSRANSRAVTLTHVPGYTHPVAERSEFYDEALDGAAVFFSATDVTAFESLGGKLVCVMTPYGSNIIGLLNNIELTTQGLRTEVSFKLTRVSAMASYATTAAGFVIDLETGHLIMTAPDIYDGPQFRLTEAGHLEVTQ